MRPAFTSTKSAAAFALMLLAMLLLPVVLKKSWLPPRGEPYLAVPWLCGTFPFIHHQIFEEKDDVDIAFVGSSHIFAAIDAPYVQEQLSNKLGRPAKVISLGWPWAGFDAAYFITLDLLRNRKVDLLVIYDEVSLADTLHPLSTRWFRWADDADALAGLSLGGQAGLYASAIIGAPRNMLSWLRPNLPADLVSTNKNYWEVTYHAPNPATRLGALTSRLGYNYDSRFVEFTPPASPQASDASVFSPATASMFQFDEPPVPPYQLHFMRRLANLARQHGTKAVILHLPEVEAERPAILHERKSWQELAPSQVSLMGIPSAKLFAGLTDDEIKRLFFDKAHLNQNGQRYFTRRLTPALLEMYASQTRHN